MSHKKWTHFTTCQNSLNRGPFKFGGSSTYRTIKKNIIFQPFRFFSKICSPKTHSTTLLACFRRWQQRYFRLEGCYLRYMQTPTSNAKKTFNLRKAVDLNAPWWRRSEGISFVCLPHFKKKLTKIWIFCKPKILKLLVFRFWKPFFSLASLFVQSFCVEQRWLF